MLSNDSRASPRARGRGITLLELLLVTVIVAILAAIAVPSYRSYVMRSQRTAATKALLAIQGAEEKFFLQHQRYTDSITGDPADDPPGLGLLATAEGGMYALTVAPADGGSIDSSFVAVARAQGGQLDDRKCRLFRIDQNGLKYAEDSGGDERTDDCWN